MQISRDNHYVPRLYLKNWENNGKIKIYNLIVPDKRVPLWVTKSSKSIAFQTNLYTRIEQGKEVDDFEEDFCKRFEMPAKPCLDKLINDEKLTANEWTKVTDFISAQFVRTPAFFLYINEFAKDIIPDTLDELLNTVSNNFPKKNSSRHKSEKKILPVEIKIKKKDTEKGTNILDNMK